MSALQENRFNSFKSFWPYYLSQHSHPATRTIHALGTSLGLLATAAAAVTVTPLLIPVGIASIYGVLAASHVAFDRNTPATFQKLSVKNVLWSMLGDFRMGALWFRGRVRAEYQRLGLDPDGGRRKAGENAAQKKIRNPGAVLPGLSLRRLFGGRPRLNWRPPPLRRPGHRGRRLRRLCPVRIFRFQACAAAGRAGALSSPSRPSACMS